MYNILIFGTGDGCRKVQEILDYSKVRILSYVDNNKTKQGRTLGGINVIDPKHIKSYNYDFIVIASMYYKEIENQLMYLGVTKNKICSFFKLDSKIVCRHPKVIEFSNSEKIFDGFVTGISYAEYGIDCSKFSRNIFNFALSSQDLFHDYSIIKFCFEKFPHKMKSMKYALIVLEYYSFDYEQKRTKVFEKKFLPIYRFVKESGFEFNIFNKEFEKCYYDNEILLKHNKAKKEMWNKELSKQDIKKFYIDIEKFKKEFNKYFLESIKLNKEIFLEYLKILNSYKISPIIIICPQNKHIRNIVTNKTKNKFFNILNEYKDQYSFQVLDYFNNDMFDEADYFDISHLNKFGAEKLTQLLEKDINWMYSKAND